MKDKSENKESKQENESKNFESELKDNKQINDVLDGQFDFSQIEEKEIKNNQLEKNLEVANELSEVKKSKRKKSKQDLLPPFGGETTIFKSLDEVLHESMIPYTEHVVMDRALPRVEDGLKPVQRRILFSMLELGLEPDKSFRKSARIVGDCMGKYHPHGDSSVYEAMVRMAQDFSLRETLVHGHGNFGSIDGDSAAAMRYTEAKLTPLAMLLLKDLEKNTVHWSYNFDDTLKEPDMLPGAFPNLLVNGASGIAVGVATNIPPHNLEEVINGIVAYIANKEITLEEMMQYIKGPDFPTGAYLLTDEELVNAYQNGKGKIIIRAKVDIEKDGDKEQLVISSIPYQVNKAALLQKIVELKDNNKDKLFAISEIRDESDRKGMRAVIKLKKDANTKAILEYLYKTTSLQASFGINMVAIANGKPKQMGLLEIISYYVEYQREIVYRRTEYDLNVAKEREHIVEGLLIAIANIDEVIKIIKSSSSVMHARDALIERFKLSIRQAQAILDMKLSRLVNLEILKLQEELKQLKKLIIQLTEILNSKAKQYNVVKNQLLEIKKQFGNPRRSQILDLKELKNEKNDIEPERVAFAREIVVGLTAAKTIKQIPMKNYSLSQKEVVTNSTLFDVHTQLRKTKTDAQLLMFTDKGNCLRILADKIPEAKWREKGSDLLSLCKYATRDEVVVSIIILNKEIKNEFLYFMTSYGYIKKILLENCIINKNFYQVMKLKQDDSVISVENAKLNSSIIMVSKDGNTLNFDPKDLTPQSRGAGGVFGININENDRIICAEQASTKGFLTILTNNGYCKKVPISEFSVMPRYRKGLKIINNKDGIKSIVYADYNELSCSIALINGEKIHFIDSKEVEIADRVAKGKQLHKGKFQKAFRYEV